MIYDEEVPELLTEEELKEESLKLLKRLKKEGMESLSQSIMSKLKTRVSNRSAKQEEWLECSHLYYGSMYSNHEYKETPFSNSAARRKRPDFNIVRTKCDTAIAQHIDMQFSIGEKNWDIWPAADNLEPSAATKCGRMSDTIESQLESCRYAFNSREAIKDRIILGTGIMKGPTNLGKVKTTYYQDPMTGKWLTRTSVVYNPVVERVDPWFFFPDDTVTDSSKLEDAIQVHPMSKYELMELRNLDGYDKEAIEEVLKGNRTDYYTEQFTEYKKLVDANPSLFKDKYCVVEYHGPISRKYLTAAGIEPAIDSPLEDFYGEVWLVDGQIFRIELENIEGSFETPYSMVSWKTDPASVFGFGHPLTMKDQQRVVTQTWHMILDNASISSGPQAAIQQRYIIPADGKWELAPRKMWFLTDPMTKVQDAIQFFDVPNVLQYLTPVLGLAREFSDEESGTSALAGGLESSQMGASATGDVIAMKNSTVLLDAASEEWDDQVTNKIIRRMYAWNMQYNPDDSIKGNYSIDVRTSNEFKNKQMHVRDIEKISVEMAQNPHLAKWIKPDELTTLRLSLMTLPMRDLLRTPDEAAAWEKQQQEQAAQSDPNAMKAQVEMAKLEVSKQQLALDEKVAMMDLQIDQMRLEMEKQTLLMKEQVALANNQAMAMAAQASTLKAQLEYQASMAATQAKLAETGADRQIDAAKFDTDKQIEVASLKQQAIIDNREQDLYEQEMQLKREKGEGV